MKRRCLDPKRPDFRYYGARGVQVCPRWLGRDGFRNFLEDMGVRPDGHSLDRIDPDGHYEPENCRWSTYLVQTHNRRQGWDEDAYGPPPDDWDKIPPKWPELVVEVPGPVHMEDPDIPF